MMIDEKEATSGHCYDSNCSIEPETEAKDNDKERLLRIYKRRKRRKMSDSDGTTKSEFDDKMKAVDGTAPDQDNHMLNFDAFTNGPGECSLGPCSNGHENGQNTYLTYQESGYMPVIKKSFNNVERNDNHTNNSAPELSDVMSCGSLKQSEGSTSSEFCSGLLSDILNSDTFSELRGLLLKNFGVVNVNQVLDIDAISLKMKNGAYETSPMLYVKDIQQVWTKLQQVGSEMVTLANNLSDISRAHYDQFFRKSQATEARDCQGCGEKAEVGNCLVCDSCEDIYHLCCTDLAGTEIPLLSWYCASCLSNGAGSPHDNCVVCEKLNGVSTNDKSQNVPNNLHDVTDENNQSSNICFMCKSEVKMGDDFKKCGHSLCGHKFYHSKCLTRKQLVVSGPCWYCPSCLCRRCLVDKDDDQIVLCDCCDEAYHIYCTSPQLLSIPKGSWFCNKCDRKVKGINTMKRVYESMQKKVKIEDGSEEVKLEEAMDEREGLDMLVTEEVVVEEHMVVGVMALVKEVGVAVDMVVQAVMVVERQEAVVEVVVPGEVVVVEERMGQVMVEVKEVGVALDMVEQAVMVEEQQEVGAEVVAVEEAVVVVLEEVQEEHMVGAMVEEKEKEVGLVVDMVVLEGKEAEVDMVVVAVEELA